MARSRRTGSLDSLARTAQQALAARSHGQSRASIHGDRPGASHRSHGSGSRPGRLPSIRAGTPFMLGRLTVGQKLARSRCRQWERTAAWSTPVAYSYTFSGIGDPLVEPGTWLFDLRTGTWSRGEAVTPEYDYGMWGIQPAIAYDEAAERTRESAWLVIAEPTTYRLTAARSPAPARSASGCCLRGRRAAPGPVLMALVPHGRRVQRVLRSTG